MKYICGGLKPLKEKTKTKDNFHQNLSDFEVDRPHLVHFQFLVVNAISIVYFYIFGVGYKIKCVTCVIYKYGTR